MANIKSMTRSKEKWARVSAQSGTEYAEGVQNPRSDWATQTQAAEKQFEQGVQAAITRKAFGKGVKKAGTETWQKAALDKGPSRFAQGVQGAQDKYETGFKPYADVIANLKLPPRGAKGDPANIQRVTAVATALHAEKIKREGV